MAAATAALFATVAAAAQAPAPIVQSEMAALAQDAGEYARLHSVTTAEAMQRLLAQEAGVPAVDALVDRYRDRLAGIVVEHRPAYRYVLLLTGEVPVADEVLDAGGLRVPVTFRTGAVATRAQLQMAAEARQADLRAALPHPPGIGVDERSGTLAVMVRAGDVAAEGVPVWEARLSAIAGVPVQVHLWSDVDANLAVQGGGRLTGTGADGRRYICTAGFVVTDGSRKGIATAAHCPDAIRFVEPGQPAVPLTLAGAWGARYQDVQIHVAPSALEPLFLTDTARTHVRAVTSWRNRASTRVGDFVCHRGERTGYSCAEVAYVSFAPPGDLCAGPCTPSWVAVNGPDCRSGDSGGPVFLRSIAFGILKGASYATDGTCRLYYYMSVDDLPAGWTLLHR